ncbi:helix-turn-helix domain-containing protein [Photobacterium phosphoreum]|uniref:helix-turn-helix domain-containing protein n=1 Tax=Photobacterium phosphoreum TaxID=659 RepID=UPI001F34A229|nr:hypothetical protein [Photobacterium phosphoreum]
MLLTMTENELSRIKIIQDVCDNQITGVEAARRLNLSCRQLSRLVKRFTQFGASGGVIQKAFSVSESDSPKL